MYRYLSAAALGSLFAAPAFATIISFTDCTITCDVSTDPVSEFGGLIEDNPDDGRFVAWDEVQNFTLTEDLRVDRVFDETADFVTDAGGGDFLIKAGTIVSSHYVQYDPTSGGTGNRNQATITLDSEVFAFIFSDGNLENSDGALGLPGLDYNDFTLRGLENGDTTTFDGNSSVLDWSASTPGDWTRLITAFSPTAVVPVPASLPLLAAGIGGLALLRRRRG